MVLVLYLVFPVRRRLLALPVVLVGVLVAFGTANLPGVKIPLTMITMGGLPVLIGLGADFSIQFQNRYEEEIRNKRHARAVIDTVARIGPSTLIAVIATSVGFSTLLLSQVPAVRDFSTLLIIGIISLFAAALFLLVPIIHLLDRRKNGNGSNDLDDENNGNLENEGTFVPDTASQHVTNGKEKTGKTGFVPQVSPAEGNGKPAVTPTATTMLAQGTESDTTAKAQNQQSTEKDLGGFVVFLTKLSGWSIRHGVVIIAVSSLLAAAGFVADSNLTVQTELKKMIPSDTPAVEAFDRAREVMGSTEQLPIMLIADDVTSPEMMSWLTDFAERTVQNYPEILMSNSVLNLIPGEQIPNSEQFKALLQFMPEEISNSLITPDFKRTTITFALDEISATRMAEVLDSILKDANPPAGSSLAAGGAMTLMAQGASKFTEGREIQIILGLIGVFLVLLAVYQRIRRALIPVIPIALRHRLVIRRHVPVGHGLESPHRHARRPHRGSRRRILHPPPRPIRRRTIQWSLPGRGHTTRRRHRRRSHQRVRPHQHRGLRRPYRLLLPCHARLRLPHRYQRKLRTPRHSHHRPTRDRLARTHTQPLLRQNPLPTRHKPSQSISKQVSPGLARRVLETFQPRPRSLARPRPTTPPWPARPAPAPQGTYKPEGLVKLVAPAGIQLKD